MAAASYAAAFFLPLKDHQLSPAIVAKMEGPIDDGKTISQT